MVDGEYYKHHKIYFVNRYLYRNSLESNGMKTKHNINLSTMR